MAKKSAAAATPAQLFTPDPDGEQVFASDEHRRVLARCNPGVGITFTVLHERLAEDPFTYGIGPDDQGRLGQIISELTADGDLVQLSGGVYEATPQGWEKVTDIKAGT